MEDKNQLIILLINSKTDRQLLANFLRQSNYIIEERIPDLSSEKLAISTILVDEYNAQANRFQLLTVKQHIGMRFLPIVVLLPQKSQSSNWLEMGYDEIIRMPVIKHEFLSRLKGLLKLREDSESQYRLLFKNINIGIYKMNPEMRITTANKAFVRLLGFSDFFDIGSKTLSEMNIITSVAREDMINKLNKNNLNMVYESVWMVEGRELIFRENIYFVNYKNIISYVCTIEDLTSKKETEKALIKNEEKYRQLIEYSPYGIIIVQDQKIKFVNYAFIKMMRGKDLTDLLEKNVMDIVHPDYHDIVKTRINIASEQGVWNNKLEEKFICLDKTVIDVEVIACGINFEGRPAAQATVNDVTENLKSKQIINHMAYHDALTDLYNRIKFEEIANQDIAIAQEARSQVAILFLDLDNFKNINDTLGHRIGDLLLIEVANRLTKNVGKFDSVGRLGGDEFVMALVSHQNPHFNIKNSVAKIFKSILKPFNINNNILNVTASIGISLFPKDGRDLATLFKNADIAMYSAKKKGRNNFEFCSLKLIKSLDKKVKIENELREALLNKELFLCFQPRLALPSRKIVGVEALLRCTYPPLDSVSPSKFIPIAEDVGLIFPLTEFVLEECCKQMHAWRLQGFSIPVAINLSVKNFQNPGILDLIYNTLMKYNVAPAMLEIEITESLIMKDIVQTQNILAQLKKWGIKIFIDDFGTGYSSLSYLRRFNIDALKIDASFIQDILVDSNQAAIVIAIIAMANTLKLTVVAEGVENEDQLDFLIQHGCDEIQGFHFCPPLIAKDLYDFFIDFNK